ncbi:MAG: adaptor protein MecA [Clostridia bacterium]|nr:adaptor protein MecA [Clostridia bacterium]
MELILISDSKLKIMLSQKDMTKYALKIEDIDYDNTETRRAFWNILDEAKHKTGFDAARERIFVQVFPSRCGGCEIFVTKLEKGVKAEDLSVSVAKRKENTVYRFSDIKDLLSVCAVLTRKGYKGESSAYCNDRYYYLSVSGEELFIDEYADMRENKKYIYHILEHCDRICTKGAVETLGSLR